MTERIRELSDKEQARMRVAVFFGSSKNFFHTFIELLGNALDEAYKGYGDKIEVSLSQGGKRVKIKDYANGLPVDVISENGKEGYISLLETLFAGGKFDQGTEYQLGLNGVGLTTTILTSEYAKVTVGRPNGNVYQVEYANGDRLYDLKIVGKTDYTFTEIEWTCDKKVFSDNVFSWEEICNTVNNQAAISNVNIVCTNEDTNDIINYKYDAGILEYLQKLIPESANIEGFTKNLEIDFSKGEEIKTDKVHLDFAFAITNKGEPVQMDFLNSSNLTYYGTIQEGVTNSFRVMVHSYLRANNLYTKNEKQITNDDILASLNYVANLKSLYPEYENQIKKKTLVPHYKEAVSEMIKSFLEIYFIENKIEAEKISKQILINKRAREKSLKTMENVKKKLSEEISIFNKIEGFIDCEIEKGGELFICEGKSALGSVINARDEVFQAGFPIRGKILNCLKADLDKIFANKEVTDLIRLFGCGIEIKTKHNKELPKFDLNKLRWDKIILTCDADADGEQIVALLLTFIYVLVPTLLKEGYVYIAQTPLYELHFDDDSVYYIMSESEMNRELPKLKDRKYTISRSKGLGELEPKVMRETAMNPETRNLLRVKVEDVESMMKAFETWMSDAGLSDRKEYIENNLHKVRID